MGLGFGGAYIQKRDQDNWLSRVSVCVCVCVCVGGGSVAHLDNCFSFISRELGSSNVKWADCCPRPRTINGGMGVLRVGVCTHPKHPHATGLPIHEYTSDIVRYRNPKCR